MPWYHSGLDGEDLIVATASPADKQSLQAIAAIARRPVRPLLATYPEIRAALNKIYGGKLISPPRPRLGQLLSHLGHITAEGLAQALADQVETGEPLGQICLRLGLVDEYDLVEGWHGSIIRPTFHCTMSDSSRP